MNDEVHEFPKWVTPHESHISSAGGHVSVLGDFQSHIDRAGNVTVLVHDAEHEAHALAARVEAATAHPENDAKAEG